MLGGVGWGSAMESNGKLNHDFPDTGNSNHHPVPTMSSPETTVCTTFSYEKPKWVLQARRRYLTSIREAMSRKTGFCQPIPQEQDHEPSEETKTNDTSEHWVFGVEQRRMQAVNCETCGEYLMTSQFDFFIDILPDRCVCRCDRMFP